jgi:hypothetical protein
MKKHIKTKSEVYAEELTGNYRSGFCERDQFLLKYSIRGKPLQNASSIT